MQCQIAREMPFFLTRIDQFWTQTAQWLHRRPWIGWLALLLGVAGFVCGGLMASHSRLVNAKFSQGDQSAYLQYARKLRETNFQHLGDRNRMPLYPGLQSLFIQNGDTKSATFERGKYVNIGLALAGLALLWLGMRRVVTGWGNWLFTGGLAMGLFLPKAAYFQAEILYYTLFALFFMGGAYLLYRPRWWVAALLGVVAALTHWTKASILPGVVLLTLALGLRMIYATWRSFRERPEARSTAWQCLLGVILLPMVYLGGIAPYLLKSAEHFDGHYFYNVNSTFYIWCDNFEQTKKLEDAGDRKWWPRLPADELPSARKYFTEKAPDEIAGRLFGGMIHQFKIAKGSYGAWRFILPLVLLAAWQFWSGRAGIEPWARKYNWSLFFAACFFGAYFTLISFYSPLADGARFLFALYAPSLAAAVWVIENFARSERKRLGADIGVQVRTWVYRLVTVLVIIELPLKLLTFMGKVYCGS